jgi:hypothetical protein
MKRNLGRVDRTLRACAGLALCMCSIFAPLPLLVRVLAFGVTGCVLFLTALVGACPGYALLGISSCSSEEGLSKPGKPA